MGKVVALNNNYYPLLQLDEKLVNGVSLILAEAAEDIIREVYRDGGLSQEGVKLLFTKAAEVAAARVLEAYSDGEQKEEPGEGEPHKVPAAPAEQPAAPRSFLVGKNLQNKHCVIEYDGNKKSFSGRDLDDQYNLPAFYNTTRRSHKKAAKALLEQFNENTTMYDAMRILRDNNISCHSWCTMD